MRQLLNSMSTFGTPNVGLAASCQQGKGPTSRSVLPAYCWGSSITIGSGESRHPDPSSYRQEWRCEAYEIRKFDQCDDRWNGFMCSEVHCIEGAKTFLVMNVLPRSSNNHWCTL